MIPLQLTKPALTPGGHLEKHKQYYHATWTTKENVSLPHVFHLITIFLLINI